MTAENRRFLWAMPICATPAMADRKQERRVVAGQRPFPEILPQVADEGTSCKINLLDFLPGSTPCTYLLGRRLSGVSCGDCGRELLLVTTLARRQPIRGDKRAIVMGYSCRSCHTYHFLGKKTVEAGEVGRVEDLPPD